MQRTPARSGAGDDKPGEGLPVAVDQQKIEEFKVMKSRSELTFRRLLRVQDAVYEDPGVPNGNLLNKQFLLFQQKTLEAASKEMHDLQMQILGLGVGEEVENTSEAMYLEFERLYGQLYVSLSTRIAEIDRKEDSLFFSAARPAQVAPVPTMQYYAPPLKVPLPTFDGTYENWYAFKSMFQTVMSRYKSESSAIKLYHLRNSLVGQAAGFIDQDIINNNDYAAAWVMLQDRFEDRRLIIDKHIDALMDLPKLSSESAVDLRKLVDVCTKNVDALKNLGLHVAGLGESMIINRIASKLDVETRKAWEINQKKDELPDYADTMEFLRERCRVLEKIRPVAARPVSNVQRTARAQGDSKLKASSFVAATEQCSQCSECHELWQCDTFKKTSLSDRYATLRKLGACYNCLRKGHRTTNCTSDSSCKKCNKRHHSILHPEESQLQQSTANIQPSLKPAETTQKPTTITATVEAVEEVQTQSSFCVRPKTGGKQILLSTAVVLVYGKSEQPYPCRVLLDSGSHTNFVTESFAALLSLDKETAHFTISGLNDIKTKVHYKIHTAVKSRVSEYRACLDFLVVPQVTGLLPLTKIDPTTFSIPAGVQLADPNFDVPDRVDMLLGAEVFYELLKTERMQVPQSSAVLQDTQFGWVLSGPVPEQASNVLHSFCTTADEDLSALVKRFWQIDSFGDPEPTRESEEAACKQHYLDTHKRTLDGRYVVRLPFNDLQHKLGNSRKVAEKRFYAVEKRLDAAPDVKQQYSAFLREYEDLGHMKQNDTADDDDPHSVYYLPHHYVLKPSSSTTKLRVVFDGSAESSSGISINKTQMIGPVVQNHLVQILLIFRSYKFVFTLDIPKMYRQVLVHKDDIPYQRIVWREARNQPLRTYDLQTVTYGLASSPFLATMTLNQLAEDEGHLYPLAADVVRNSFYIDDALTGANTLEETIELKNQIVALLAKGGFEAHKFCANSELILADTPKERCEGSVDIEDPSINVIMKTLGVSWKPKEDCFTFVVPQNVHVKITRATKRSILSDIAKIFDPLGFLGPVITTAKLIMRDLWSSGLDWDDPVPPKRLQIWSKFYRQLESLNAVTIPRWIFDDKARQIELHGFADASDVAYGACIYTRLLMNDGSAMMQLVCSKSRILPTKKENQKEITTPRAELLAAQLLARLITQLLGVLKTTFDSIILWSDSQIVLCWLRRSPETLSVYVGNRVREIQQLTAAHVWRYIPSKENPADIISRGLLPASLPTSMLWWNGPPTIRTDGTELPLPLSDEELPELRRTALPVVAAHPRVELFDRISRFTIMQRSMAYVVRFCDHIRSRRTRLTTGLPTVDEMERATKLIIRLVQGEVFDTERRLLKNSKYFRHPMRHLNPFIDKTDGILRVGGRLKHADIPYESKHQALLPEKHPLTTVLLRHLHRTNMHIGQRGLLGIVRQQYWPLHAKSLIRQLIHHCVPCFRMTPRPATQLMGDLPDYRVRPAPVFAETGLDFAGPFRIRSNTATRKPQETKGYVCVFVCMSTRALHLEPVSNLTTEAFMGALHRFVSRRGIPRKLHSDNATNFEGANNEMNRLAKLFQDEHHQRTLNEYSAQKAIEWHFIPPRSPHFGGIWEAGVKSVKFHLKRVLAEHKLSYEELATVLTQIEAVLNSRPLTPVSDDPNDLGAITPAHFLIGHELQAIPEPSYQHIPQGRLSRWQFVQDLKQKFWNIWMADYLHELQRRQKDFKITKLKVGALVVIVDENAPPLQWMLARITDLHPGSDGIVRVVGLRTKTGTTTRAVKKVCLLPLDNEEADDLADP